MREREREGGKKRDLIASSVALPPPFLSAWVRIKVFRPLGKRVKPYDVGISLVDPKGMERIDARVHTGKDANIL